MKIRSAKSPVKAALISCACLILYESFSSVEQSTVAAQAVWESQKTPVRRRSAARSAQRSAAAPASNAALGGYINRLRSKLMRIWEPPDGKNAVVLQALVDQSGAVSEINTATSRAGEVAIQAATIAFEKVQPLEALPVGSNKGKLTIIFTSSVDPHGDSTSNITTKIDPLAPSPSQKEAKAPTTTPAANTDTTPGTSMPGTATTTTTTTTTTTNTGK
jgi:hypothetical protein